MLLVAPPLPYAGRPWPVGHDGVVNHVVSRGIPKMTDALAIDFDLSQMIDDLFGDPVDLGHWDVGVAGHDQIMVDLIRDQD